MNHLVIDLEMCMVPVERKKLYRYNYEIIQIGAVMLDEKYQVIDTFEQFVCPQFGVIDPYIERLTGISSKMVRKAPVLQKVLDSFVDWIDGRECKIYSWSDADYRQLVQETRQKRIRADKYAALRNRDNWVNYQKIFDTRFNLKQNTGLFDAVNAVGLTFSGRCHDGLVDAMNTAMLIAKLETTKEITLILMPKVKPSYQTPPLGFGLGELLDRVDL